jgi:predicted tellurium resistance membrane protein TerC
MSRDHPMSKRTITRLFVGAIVAVSAGLVLVLAAVWAAVASGLVMTVTLVVVGSLAMLAGAVAAVVSWIGALLNTAKLEDKTWFVSLLVLSLFSLGVLAIVAYVLAGPDGTRRGAPPASIAPALTQQETKVQ